MNHVVSIGGLVASGSTFYLTELLKDFWREALWTTLLRRYFGARLPANHEGKAMFVSDMVQYLLPPQPTYLIPEMMNFLPDCSGTVTVGQVLRKIDQVWNPREYPTWMHAPKGPALVVKIFMDLYYDYSLRRMPFLLERVDAQMAEMQRHGIKRTRL